jgi:hypothetical protein
MFGLACGLLAAPVRASTIYSYYYIAGQSNYSVPAGGSVTVPLYLQEVNSDQSTNTLLGSEHGLTAAGVNVSFFSGASTATLTAATANSGTVPSGFDDPASAGTVNSATSATITESTDPAPFGSDLIGVEPGAQVTGVSQILLGTVKITVGSQVGQQSIFTVGVADPASGSTFTNDKGYDLDNNADLLNPAGASSLYFSAASTTFSITTTTVPEPIGLGMVLLSAVVGSLFLRFRITIIANKTQG